jgi:hypothetical protein
MRTSSSSISKPRLHNRIALAICLLFAFTACEKELPAGKGGIKEPLGEPVGTGTLLATAALTDAQGQRINVHEINRVALVIAADTRRKRWLHSLSEEGRAAVAAEQRAILALGPRHGQADRLAQLNGYANQAEQTQLFFGPFQQEFRLLLADEPDYFAKLDALTKEAQVTRHGVIEAYLKTKGIVRTPPLGAPREPASF